MVVIMVCRGLHGCNSTHKAQLSSKAYCGSLPSHSEKGWRTLESSWIVAQKVKGVHWLLTMDSEWGGSQYKVLGPAVWRGASPGLIIVATWYRRGQDGGVFGGGTSICQLAPSLFCCPGQPGRSSCLLSHWLAHSALRHPLRARRGEAAGQCTIRPGRRARGPPLAHCIPSACAPTPPQG